jgi:tRNA-dihydrouridine synthase 1
MRLHRDGPQLTLTDLTYITIPMVKQSDAAYTQMLDHQGLTTQSFFKLMIGITLTRNFMNAIQLLGRPTVVQLCRNDPETVVQAGKKIRGICEDIGERNPQVECVVSKW